MGVGKKRKIALLQTTEDFAERTSIHEISYVFDRGLKIADRVLWGLLVLSFLSLAFYLTWNSWAQWRDEQVRNRGQKNLEKIDESYGFRGCPYEMYLVFLKMSISGV